MYPPVTVLTDCTDANARARLSARVGALFGAVPALLPLEGAGAEAAAGLTLLDMLLATRTLGEDGHPTITLVNIAPRDGGWANGAPFCYFRSGRHLVVSTFNPQTLALVREHLPLERVQVTDAREAMEAASRSWASFGADEIDAVAGTQFRSLWYQPLLAKWIADGRPVPARPTAIPATGDEAARVVLVDNFGNCKINRTAAAVGFVPGEYLKVIAYRDGAASGTQEVRCYRHMAQVPQGEPGLVIGSSGTGFVELVVRCGSAARLFQLEAGCQIF